MEKVAKEYFKAGEIKKARLFRPGFLSFDL
jgi:hypothetical protein